MSVQRAQYVLQEQILMVQALYGCPFCLVEGDKKHKETCQLKPVVRSLNIDGKEV